MIVQSAIFQDDKVYVGKRHHNIIHLMVTEHSLPTPINGTQGFVDEEGKFYT